MAAVTVEGAAAARPASAHVGQAGMRALAGRPSSARNEGAKAQIALFERKTERILRTLQAEAAPLVTRPYPA